MINTEELSTRVVDAPRPHLGARVPLHEAPAPTAQHPQSSGGKTVVVCHEHDIARAGLRTLFEAEPGLRLLGDTGDAQALRHLVHRLNPDVVVVELGTVSVPALRPILGMGADCGVLPVVALAGEWRVENTMAALRAGVWGLVHSSDSSRIVLDATMAVANGEAYLAPAITRRLLGRLMGNLPDSAAIAHLERAQLTTREREVLRLVAQGLTTADIAAELGVSKATVKSHLSHTLSKLGLQDRVQAVVLAHRAGLSPNEPPECPPAPVTGGSPRHPAGHPT